MARHKEFDVDKAIEQAQELFWQHGYERTSLNTLLDAMGIGRASFYNAFQDKKSLFKLVMERYIADSTDGFIVATLRNHSGLAGVQTLFRRVVDSLANDPRHRGCMVVNSQVEFTGVPDFEDVREMIAAGQQRSHKAMVQTLTEAVVRGEVRADLDIEATAKFLMTTIRGMRVNGRTSHDRASFEQIATVAYSVLEASQPLQFS